MRAPFEPRETGLERVALMTFAEEIARRANAAGERNGPGDAVRATTLGIAANLIRRECGLTEWLFAFEVMPAEAVSQRHMRAGLRGWDRMWSVIAATYGDTACVHEGEAWQYMGSVSNDDGATWTHQFRHRSLPQTGDREHCDVPGTAEDFDAAL